MKESSLLLFLRRGFVTVLLVFLTITIGSGWLHADGDKPLTMEEALGYAGTIDQYGAIPRLRWLHSVSPDAPPTLLETRFEADGTTLYRVDARTGSATPFYNPVALENALIALPGTNKETARTISRNASLLRFDATDRRALIEIDGDLYAYEFATGHAAHVTNDPTFVRFDASLAPDGTHVAYVSGNNLYLVPIDWKTGTTLPPVPVTRDGSATVFNGRLDWVYEEELYGRGSTIGYRWSRDGKRLAFLRLDDSAVPLATLVDELARIPTTEQTPYPRAGDPNPHARLGVASVANDTHSVVWADLGEYPDSDRLIVRFGFAPDSTRLLIQVQNRIQTFLHLLTTDPTTGKTTRLITETSPAWVDVLDEPHFLTDGSFIWRSARTGFRHLYHYDAKGNLLGAVTTGNWDVTELLGVNETSRTVFFSGNQTGATQKQVFSGRLDGFPSAAPHRLTERTGTHDAVFDETGTLFLDQWNDLDNPTQLRVYAAKSGAEIRPLGANLFPLTTRRAYKLAQPRFLTIQTRDGYSMDALILKPPDFSPTKKYPVVYCLYGGPSTPTVLDKWTTVSLWHQYLAQRGCIVFMCDNRSASSKGARNVWSVYRHLGESEARDISDAMAYLRGLPYVDAKRISAYGWSYGGFLVEYLMTRTPLFSVGVAGAGVADWQLYNSVYTERYMDTPQANPAGYRNSSPIQSASQLNGKLLLLHGTMDDNVYLQNTMQLIYALQRAGKSFDIMLYPRSRHSISDPDLSRHMRTLLTTYLLENLHIKP